MPKSVWWFEKLMWLSLLLGIAGAWIDWDRIMLKVQQAGGLPDVVKTTSIITMVITFAVLLLLVFLIARVRQNWARWVFTVLFVLGLPFSLLQLPDMMSNDPAAGAISVIQMVMQIVALALVFSTDARPWFAKQAAPAPA